MEKYLELVKLQRETIGASFTIGFSTVKNKHQVYFANIKKRFEAATIHEAIDESIKYIMENREDEDGQAGLKFTLVKQNYNFRNQR